MPAEEEYLYEQQPLKAVELVVHGRGKDSEISNLGFFVIKIR
ncbi:hypothetical protein [Cytobacillus spongiae]|jgi:hypothetical protein|nr:hypothetical protein [Cytobacillus spongiae]